MSLQNIILILLIGSSVIYAGLAIWYMGTRPNLGKKMSDIAIRAFTIVIFTLGFLFACVIKWVGL